MPPQVQVLRELCAIILHIFRPTSFPSSSDLQFRHNPNTVADCKLPLAPARVLKIACRANSISLHALWPIRAPTFRLRQSERHISTAPIRTRELSSSQRRILTHVGASRLNTHATRKVGTFPMQVFVPIIRLWPSCHSLFGIDSESLYLHSKRVQF